MTQLVKKPIDQLKNVLALDSVQEQFQNALDKNAPLFIVSLVDMVASDNVLQKFNPNDIIMEALKAATLKLPINKNLGFAWIVPYGDKPKFQIGWRGYVQLAIRTGQYRKINAGIVYEGQRVNENYLTGDIVISGEKQNDEAIGYFAYFELINGFSKSWYWSKEKVHAHALKYSKSYEKSKSVWKTNSDSMCTKTVLKNLLSKYGIMSVEMVTAFSNDRDERTDEVRMEEEIQDNANQVPIDIKVNHNTGEVLEDPGQPKQEPGDEGNDDNNNSGGPDF